MTIVKDWPDICMASGEPVWFLYPERTRIRAADLQTHLARECRYNGALPWSVLQHLALCVELARHAAVAAAHLPYVAAHDLHEAVVGDLPTHLKRLLPAFAPIEDAWEAHVHRSMGLSYPPEPEVKAAVKRIDHLALALEMDRFGHAMAVGVAERRGLVVTADVRDIIASVANRDQAACWAGVAALLPALAIVGYCPECMRGFTGSERGLPACPGCGIA